MDAVHQIGHVIKRIAEATAAQRGFGAALVVFANIPKTTLHGRAYMGSGEPEAAVNIGVSGPGVVGSAEAADRDRANLTLGDLAEEIKITSFRVTRVGELIGREWRGTGGRLRDRRSALPTPTVGDSIGEIIETLGRPASERRGRPPPGRC